MSVFREMYLQLIFSNGVYMKKSLVLFVIFLFSVSFVFAEDDAVYFGNGIKIGEVKQSEAVLWAKYHSF